VREEFADEFEGAEPVVVREAVVGQHDVRREVGQGGAEFVLGVDPLDVTGPRQFALFEHRLDELVIEDVVSRCKTRSVAGTALMSYRSVMRLLFRM
jgi:hypothetical protein